MLITLLGPQGKAPEGENGKAAVCRSCALWPEVLLEAQLPARSLRLPASIGLDNSDGIQLQQGGRDLKLAMRLLCPVLRLLPLHALVQ